MTSREAFFALLVNQPLMRANAIVVLAGEDGEKRAAVCTGLLQQDAAPIVILSGGVEGAPRWIGARSLEPKLWAMGVAPQRIVLETVSQNTREQAVEIVNIAKRQIGWNRLLIVASPYHQYRAFLTILKRLQEEGLDRQMHMISVPATQTAWFESPDGVEMSRYELMAEEIRKIEVYSDLGHVATYDEAIEYLRFWEQGDTRAAA